MLLSFVGLATAVLGALVAQNVLGLLDVFGTVLCSAPENLPCRPLTLECLVAAAGGLGVAWPAINPPYDESPGDTPDQTPRPYAPEQPPGYQPPPPQSPQDALNDSRFQEAKKDWARENDRFFPTTSDVDDGGDSAYDTLVKSIQNR